MQGVRMKNYIVFMLKFAFSLIITYMVVGALAYLFITKPLYIGDDNILSIYMITMNDDIWQSRMNFQLLMLFGRAVIMSLALFPFFDTLNGWPYWKRFLTIAGIYLVFGFWSSTAAFPGSLEGLIYLKPEFTLRHHLIVQPEIIVQGLTMSALLALIMKPGKASKKAK